MKEDPWLKSYPKPSQEIDVEACLARKPLPRTPYSRILQAREAMSPEQRAAYDKERAEREAARWKAWEHERFVETIKNLKSCGFAAEVEKNRLIARPDRV